MKLRTEVQILDETDYKSLWERPESIFPSAIVNRESRLFSFCLATSLGEGKL